MKAIFISLLLIITLNLNAQFHIEQSYHKKPFSWEAVKTIGVYASSIALDAVAQGLRDNGEKDWAHVCSVASYVPLAASPWILHYQKEEWTTYIATYVGIRVMTFDYIYNGVRGLPLSYFGTTSQWDKTIGKIGGADGFFMGRVVVFAVSLSFTFNNLK